MDTNTKWFKDLRSNPRRFFSWLWEQRLVIVISFALQIPYLILFLPEMESWFLWQRRVATAGLMIHSVPFSLYITFVIPFLGTRTLLFTILFSNWFRFALFIIWDFVILYGLKKLWRRGQRGRVAIAAVLLGLGLLSVPLAYFPTSFAWPLVSPSHSSCEAINSEGDGIRIVAYSEFGPILADDHLFYLKTSDGGQSWEQVEHIVRDPTSIDQEDCLEYLQENP